MQTINKRKFEKRFKELFFDQIYKKKYELSFNPNGDNFYRKYYFNKSGDCLGNYDQKFNEFWLPYSKIWSILELEFTLNYHEVRKLTNDNLEEYYNLKGITTKQYGWMWRN